MSKLKDAQVRRRRWRVGEVRPVNFPAWRNWSDSRVRLDDAMLDALAGMRLAQVAVAVRSQSDDQRVPELFSDVELPYKSGFNVTVEASRRRLSDAEAQLALNAFPIYVSGFDDLLGEVITMLGRLDIATSDEARKAGKGVSAKLGFLSKHANVRLRGPYDHLYQSLVAVRNAVVHESASEAKARKTWEQGGQAPAKAREIWAEVASRDFPFGNVTGRLKVSDREIVGCQRAFDLIAMDLARALRQRVTPVDWARLVADEKGPEHAAILNNPQRGASKLMAWARHEWGVKITEQDAKNALGFPLA